MESILPAAGLASRMRGFPKFLLPCDAQFLTLLERHVKELSRFSDQIWIPTAEKFLPLIETLSFDKDRVSVFAISSESMTDSVLQAVQRSRAEEFAVVMPDTYFGGSTPYAFLAQAQGDLALACWEIRPDQIGKLGQVEFEIGALGRVAHVVDKDPNCHYPNFWGALTLNRSALSLANAQMGSMGEVISRAIEEGLEVTGTLVDGEYYDCGTPGEYLSMLRSQPQFG